MPQAPLCKRLRTQAKSLGLNLTEEVGDRLIQVLTLLHEWNQVHNLTAVETIEAMVERHLLDSLAAAPYLDAAERICDLGTGAGFPGLPLGILFPQKTFVLLDASLKKTLFIQHVILMLGLSNTTVFQARAESYQDTQGFDFVLSRAVTTLKGFVALGSHLCRQGGTLLAWKANLGQQELADVPVSHQVRMIQPVNLPGESKKRVLVFMNPN